MSAPQQLPQPLVYHPRTGLHKEAEGLRPEEVGAGGSFWFCRHAEVHNPRGILYGRMPRFGLTEYGRNQAEQLARFLEPRPLAALYVSPLLRARQTAQAIARLKGLQPRQDSTLLEVHTGYDGVPLAQIGDFNFYEPPANPEDDETIEAVRDRVLKFLRRAMTRHRGQEIAAVSHGDPVVILHAHYFGLPMQLASLRSPNFYPERASVTRYDFPPEGFTLDARRIRISYFEPPFE